MYQTTHSISIKDKNISTETHMPVVRYTKKKCPYSDFLANSQ